ncbi:hypothetical protein, partial [Streptomyces bambusae]|uniref:hypothetical protein n=1 Tax=Streptomyces bambusae TaxID=1550616 RepID=UPI001CA5AE65
MDNILPPAEELALVDRELAWLDARRMQLLRRREWLVRTLTAPVPAVWAPPGQAGGAAAGRGGGPAGGGGAAGSFTHLSLVPGS